MKDTRQIIIDTWATNNYHIMNESEEKEYKNESSFQQMYSNLDSKLSDKVLCIIEGRWSKNGAESVNGRFYGEDFWDIQLKKEQTQFLLRKGLMWMMFGHVDREIQDKDSEDGTVAGIVTHLEVIKQPTVLHGQSYEPGDLFGRAIIIDMGGKNAGKSTHTLLSVGCELSISSRGLGEYIIGETHKSENGESMPIMNPDTYELETFDFTRLPGVSCAEVHMVKDNTINNSNIKLTTEEDELDDIFESVDTKEASIQLVNETLDKLIFNIQKENNKMAKLDGVKIQQVLESANAKIASLTAKLEAAEEEVSKVEKERDDAIAECNRLKAEADEIIDEPKKDVTSEEDEGSDNDELEKFKAIAESPEELEDTLDKANTAIENCKEDVEELAQCKKEKEALEEAVIDQQKDLDDATQTLESYVKLGSIKQIKEATRALESYVKLGSIEQLKRLVETNLKLKKEAKRQKIAQFIESYSAKKGISQESVKRILESSKSIKDAKNILESLPNKDISKSLWKGESATPFKVVETPNSLKSFAESFIDSSEKRRNRNYTV